MSHRMHRAAWELVSFALRLARQPEEREAKRSSRRDEE